MDEHTFKARTKKFGLAVIHLIETLPRNRTSDVICRQLLRSATSVGVNYRAACRGRSGSDMVAKLGIVEEEADESIYWLELLVDSNLVPPEQVNLLAKEADEIVAMTVASIKTLRNRKQSGVDHYVIQSPKSKI
ncbi:MAG: four helix bundle protein [Terriglobia bacterium]